MLTVSNGRQLCKQIATLNEQAIHGSVQYPQYKQQGEGTVRLELGLNRAASSNLVLNLSLERQGSQVPLKVGAPNT